MWDGWKGPLRTHLLKLSQTRPTSYPNAPLPRCPVQHTLYLDNKRNWHARTHKMEEWILPFCSVSAKVFFLSDGRIGMEYGGRVIVRTIEHWMAEDDTDDDEPFFATGFTLPPDVVNAIANKEEKE
jgi:hypothetical protein